MIMGFAIPGLRVRWAPPTARPRMTPAVGANLFAWPGLAGEWIRPYTPVRMNPDDHGLRSPRIARPLGAPDCAPPNDSRCRGEFIRLAWPRRRMNSPLQARPDEP